MRDFTYVKDVAHANVMAMDWQGTFNIGTGQSYSINELADRIGGDKQYVGEREGEARMTRADNSKAAAVGWFPTKTSWTGLMKIIASFDDGSKEDLILAEMMQTYGIKTIFYFPVVPTAVNEPAWPSEPVKRRAPSNCRAP
jgi:dTDP-D-glucose 4,6-dehydratase